VEIFKSPKSEKLSFRQKLGAGIMAVLAAASAGAAAEQAHLRLPQETFNLLPNYNEPSTNPNHSFATISVANLVGHLLGKDGYLDNGYDSITSISETSRPPVAQHFHKQASASSTSQQFGHVIWHRQQYGETSNLGFSDSDWSGHPAAPASPTQPKYPAQP
jgi:hypothetical protein